MKLYVSYTFRAPNDRVCFGYRVVDRAAPTSIRDVTRLAVKLAEYEPSARAVTVLAWMPLNDESAVDTVDE